MFIWPKIFYMITMLDIDFFSVEARRCESLDYGGPNPGDTRMEKYENVVTTCWNQFLKRLPIEGI